MPPESRDDKDILNQSNNPENTSQTDFPEIEEYFGDDESKKGSILNVLKNGNIGDVFKKILNSKKSENCLFALLECKNDETKIKEVILANLPEGYAYDVSTNEVVKTEEKKDNDYTGATIMDQKTEQAKTDTEQAKTDTEQAKTDTEQAKTDTEQAVETKRLRESILVMRQAIEERDRLVAKYQEQNLDAKTNQNSENFQAVKTQLENNGTLNQLRQNHDENFINDYILVQTTLQELKSNPTNYEPSDISSFDKIVKKLENSCNIPDTNLNSFSSENITRTRHELFNSDIGNESLKKAKETNLGSRNYSGIFPEEIKKEDLINNYGNFLQGQIKQFLENYVNNTGDLKNKIEEIKNNENPTEEEKKILEFYYYMLDELEKKRKETEEQTKNLMEEMCIISQIKGMSMCIGQEEGKDFNLNKANEIINDNGVLTLKGHIDGVDFSVSHDTINPNQRLKIKSKLGVDSEDQNTFEIGKEDNYVNSPFILPSQEEIFGVITKVVQSNDLSKSSDLPKYLESLQNSIVGRMDEVYKDAELAHHYITNKVKGEKILDNSLALIQGIKPNMQDLTKPINQGSNEKLHSFMKMIKFNVENSTTEEKNKLNKCLSKIPEIVDAYKTTKGVQNFVELKYPLIIENYLKNQTWLEEGNEDTKLGLVFDLFSYYNQNSKDTRANVESSDGAPSKMIIEDLYRDLFEFQSSQSLIATTRKNEETEKQDKQDADDELASIDWPPVPMAV